MSQMIFIRDVKYWLLLIAITFAIGCESIQDSKLTKRDIWVRKTIKELKAFKPNKDTPVAKIGNSILSIHSKQLS